MKTFICATLIDGGHCVLSMAQAAFSLWHTEYVGKHGTSQFIKPSV